MKRGLFCKDHHQGQGSEKGGHRQTFQDTSDCGHSSSPNQNQSKCLAKHTEYLSQTIRSLVHDIFIHFRTFFLRLENNDTLQISSDNFT